MDTASIDKSAPKVPDRETLLREATKANAYLANPKSPEVVKPWWLKGAEFGISSAAQIGGEAVGATAAAPVAATEAATGVGVPAAGVTEVAGAAAGAGVGSVVGDVANRALDRATGYGKAPIIPTAGEVATSFGLGAAGSLGGRALGAIGSRLTGLRATKGAIAEATGEKATQSAEAKAAVQAETATKEAVGRSVGLTPDEAAKATAQTFEERAGSGAAGREAVKGARAARIKETGELFNPIYDPIKDNIVPHEQLVSTATNSTQAIGNALGKQGITTEAGQRAALAELSPDTRQYLGQIAQMGALRPGGEVSAGVKEATIGELRKLNSNMMALAAKTNDPTERLILRNASQPFRDVLDAAVPEEQKPLLAALKQQYGQINKELPFALAKRIDKATSLPEMGNILYGDPKKVDAAMELWKAGNPEQKSMMKSMFAQDLMTNHGGTAKELGAALQGRQRIMRAMFGDDAFSQAQTWVNVDARRGAMEKLVNQSPKAQNEFERGVKQAIDEAGAKFDANPVNRDLKTLTREEMNKTADDALRQHSKVGGMAKYLGHQLAMETAIGVTGGGAYLHNVPMMVGAGAYLLRRAAWAAAMDNPAVAAGYRKAIMSPNVQKAGYLMGRLMTTAAVEAAKGEPESQGGPSANSGSGSL
jgi:hypothetical protein